MARRLLFLFLFSAIIVAVIQMTAGIREKVAEARYPYEGKRLDLGDIKIHAEVFGETGPDLILIHGASGNTRDFTFSMAEKLSTRYRVIVFDRPGMGWSTQPPGFGGLFDSRPESPRLMADILGRAAEELGVENPIVLGHSLGGALAMAWALEHPDNTAALVMVAGVSHPWPGDLHWQYPVNSSVWGGNLFVPLLTAFVPRSYINGVVEGVFAPQAAPKGYIDHIGTGLSTRRASLRANARQVNGLRPFVVEMSEFYPDLTLPIEIVHGDADTIVPLAVHSVPLSERVESANLTVLDGIGHMPHHTNEADVIAAIDRAAARAGLR